MTSPCTPIPLASSLLATSFQQGQETTPPKLSLHKLPCTTPACMMAQCTPMPLVVHHLPLSTPLSLTQCLLKMATLCKKISSHELLQCRQLSLHLAIARTTVVAVALAVALTRGLILVWLMLVSILHRTVRSPHLVTTLLLTPTLLSRAHRILYNSTYLLAYVDYFGNDFQHTTQKL